MAPLFLRCALPAALFLASLSGSASLRTLPQASSNLASLETRPRQRQRDLQTIIIINEEDEKDEDEIIDERNPAAPRPTRLVVCSSVQQEDVFAKTTTVVFNYMVQFVREPDTGKFTAVNVPDWVSGATVDGVAKQLCSDGGADGSGGGDGSDGGASGGDGSGGSGGGDGSGGSDGDDGSGGSGGGDGSGAASGGEDGSSGYQCVLSVSSGNDALAEEQDCVQPCAVYDGSVKVTHTDECTSEEIKQAVLDFLLNKSQGGDIDKALQEKSGGVVDTVTYSIPPTTAPTMAPTVDPDFVFVGAQKNIIEEDGGMTAGGKMLISFLAILLLLLLMVCCVWRRKALNRRRKLEDDLKSCKTAWSKGSQETPPFQQPDFHDLALSHTKLDVHQCKSSTCRVCRPDLGLVDIFPVPRGSNMDPVKVIVAEETRQAAVNAERSMSPLTMGDVEQPQQRSSRVAPAASYGLEDGMACTPQEVEQADTGASNPYCCFPTYCCSNETKEEDAGPCGGTDTAEEPMSCENADTHCGDVEACSEAALASTFAETKDEDDDVTFIRTEEKSTERLGGWQKFNSKRRSAAAREVVL